MFRGLGRPEVAEQPACDTGERDRSDPEVDRLREAFRQHQSKEITEVEGGWEGEGEQAPGGRRCSGRTKPSVEHIDQESSHPRTHQRSDRAVRLAVK